MKNVFLVIATFICCLLNAKSEEKNMQKQELINNSYEAIIRESCSRGIDEMYMTYTYCKLSFAKDSVDIVTYSVSTGNMAEEDHFVEKIGTFDWKIENNRVCINGFDNYGMLEIQGSKLIGKEEYGEGRYKEMIFEKINLS